MDALAADHQGASCLNCGTALVGAYCHQCGQEADTGRITWGTLLREHYRALGRLDSEILRTAWALTTDPGGFCRQYLAGRRRGRTAPVSYFFVSFFASFLLLAADRWLFRDSRAGSSALGPLQTQLLVLTAAFVWAAAHRLVFRRAGYTLPEHAVCMLYLYGQTNIVSALLMIASAPLASRWPSSQYVLGTAGGILSFGYFAFFGSRLYQRPIARAFVDTLAAAALFAVFLLPTLFAWVIVNAAVAARL